MSDYRKRHNRFQGWLWIASGLLLLASFMAVAIYFGLLPGIGGLVNVLWSLFIALSFLLIIRGRKMVGVDAASLLEKDKRPSIVYLRPFSEDKRFPPQRGLALLRSKRAIKLQGGTPTTYEEQVSIALRHLGPFIAIGNPKEGLPELGAARMYVNNSEWHQQVKELITTAGLIFMQVGESDGFLWELEQVIKTAKPHQLILGLPFVGKGGEKARQAQYDSFRTKTPSLLPKGIPEKIGEAQFIYFEEGWLPHLFTPCKSAPLPQYAPMENSEFTLQFEALEGLRSEFMLVSTPYWFRSMIIMMTLSLPLLFLLLAVFFDFWING